MPDLSRVKRKEAVLKRIRCWTLDVAPEPPSEEPLRLDEAINRLCSEKPQVGQLVRDRFPLLDSRSKRLRQHADFPSNSQTPLDIWSCLAATRDGTRHLSIWQEFVLFCCGTQKTQF